MAEFLIANRDTSVAGGCAIGDIRDVRPDGWNWSKAELPNVVKLSGVAYDRKYKLPDQRVYTKPVIDRAGNYYDLVKMEAGLQGTDVFVAADPAKIDVYEGDVKQKTLADGKELVKDRGDDAPTKTVVLKFGDVVLETRLDSETINKRRYRISGGVIIDKTV
jgi:hypothetical protein